MDGETPDTPAKALIAILRSAHKSRMRYATASFVFICASLPAIYRKNSVTNITINRVGHIANLLFLCYNCDISHIWRVSYGCVYLLRPPGLSGVYQTETTGDGGGTNCGVRCGLVLCGTPGAFDAMARAVLRELTEVYPHISYAVVLEWLPGPRDKAIWDFSDTIFPEGLETMPPRFAIARRNKWMLRQADYVVTYITHGWGCAAQFAEKAQWQGKTVFNLAQKYPVSNDD